MSNPKRNTISSRCHSCLVGAECGCDSCESETGCDCCDECDGSGVVRISRELRACICNEHEGDAAPIASEASAHGQPTGADQMHPTGRCTCGGGGMCAWCVWRNASGDNMSDARVTAEQAHASVPSVHGVDTEFHQARLHAFIEQNDPDSHAMRLMAAQANAWLQMQRAGYDPLNGCNDEDVIAAVNALDEIEAESRCLHCDAGNEGAMCTCTTPATASRPSPFPRAQSFEARADAGGASSAPLGVCACGHGRRRHVATVPHARSNSGCIEAGCSCVHFATPT